MIQPSQPTPVEEALRLFGRRVRAARKAAKLTIEAAAERADLRSTFLGEIERAEKRPSFQTIVTLAAALGVAPIVFFQFGCAETDPILLKQAIQEVLQGSSPPQLQQAYRVIQAVVGP
jgi:transcriptional regulator with XRE-family HTH domain